MNRCEDPEPAAEMLTSQDIAILRRFQRRRWWWQKITSP